MIPIDASHDHLARCRAEHTAIRRLIARMPSAEPFAEEDAAAVLRRLRVVLQTHFKREDSELYPLLESSPNAVLGRKAARYREHMGGIAEVFAAFCAEWTAPGAIAARPGVFLDRWIALRASLDMRMESEDEDLYVMADQVFTGAH